MLEIKNDGTYIVDEFNKSKVHYFRVNDAAVIEYNQATQYHDGQHSRKLYEWTDIKNIGSGYRELCPAKIKDYAKEKSFELRVASMLTLDAMRAIQKRARVQVRREYAKFGYKGTVESGASIRLITENEVESVNDFMSLPLKRDLVAAVAEHKAPGVEIIIEGRVDAIVNNLKYSRGEGLDDDDDAYIPGEYWSLVISKDGESLIK